MIFHLLEVKLLRFKCQYVFVIGAKMSFEQRDNITETFQLMKQVYGDETLVSTFSNLSWGHKGGRAETQKIAPGEVKSEDNADLFL